jgi:hypothetical protein
MSLPPARKFVRPLPNEDWNKLAARVFPDQDTETSVSTLQSWNFHVFMRPAAANGNSILPSDILFVEAPAPG